MGFFSKLLSVGESKPLKNYQRRVAEVNAFEPAMQARSDEELAHLTVEFRERLANGEDLDDLLPEAFAAVREASVRTIGLRHFDVQLIGAMALNDGKIAEMRTGEGKTLVSTLAGYLNALPGNNVHIVTVNDYLAARDSQWMGRIYRFLGMNVGLIQNGMGPEQKIPAYQADVTYGTNSALIICVTTWLPVHHGVCSVAILSPSSTRSTPSLSMKRVHLLLFLVLALRPPIRISVLRPLCLP